MYYSCIRGKYNVLIQWHGKGHFCAFFWHCIFQYLKNPEWPALWHYHVPDPSSLHSNRTQPWSRVFKHDNFTSFEWKWSIDDGSGVCRGKVETVNGTTDHINTFLKSHFWHPQLETQPAWETLHVINISLMHSSAYNSFAKKAGEKAGIPLTTKVINLYLNENSIHLRE